MAGLVKKIATALSAAAFALTATPAAQAKKYHRVTFDAQAEMFKACVAKSVGFQGWDIETSRDRISWTIVANEDELDELKGRGISFPDRVQNGQYTNSFPIHRVTYWAESGEVSYSRKAVVFYNPREFEFPEGISAPSSRNYFVDHREIVVDDSLLSPEERKTRDVVLDCGRKVGLPKVFNNLPVFEKGVLEICNISGSLHSGEIIYDCTNRFGRKSVTRVEFTPLPLARPDGAVLDYNK